MPSLELFALVLWFHTLSVMTFFIDIYNNENVQLFKEWYQDNVFKK